MRILWLCAVLIGFGTGAAVAQGAPAEAAAKALHEAAFAGELEEARKLVESGTPVDIADSEKHTALMWAAFNGHTEVVAYLLEHGAGVEAQDSIGRTALMYGSSGPNDDTVRLLLEKGAEINLQDTGEKFTALMIAAAEGLLDVVKLLLAHEADPALRDVDGDTAESFAVLNKHPAVAELLRAASQP